MPFQVSNGVQLQDRNEIRPVDNGLIIGTLLFSKEPFIRPLRQRRDPRLNTCINLELSHASGGLGVQAFAQRIQKAVQYAGSARIAHALTVPRHPIPNESNALGR